MPRQPNSLPITYVFMPACLVPLRAPTISPSTQPTQPMDSWDMLPHQYVSMPACLYILHSPGTQYILRNANPLHYGRKAITLCYETHYIMVRNPLHYGRKPITLCYETHYFMVRNPLHYGTKPITLWSGDATWQPHRGIWRWTRSPGTQNILREGNPYTYMVRRQKTSVAGHNPLPIINIHVINSLCNRQSLVQENRWPVF